MVACETCWNNATERILPGDSEPGAVALPLPRGRSWSVSSKIADATAIKVMASHNRRKGLNIRESRRGDTAYRARVGERLGDNARQVHVPIR